MKSKLIILATVAAALAVAGCGSDDNAASGSKPGNTTDRAFVADMIPHHESAVEMATIAQERGSTPFVKTLSANIIRTQKQEIDTMRAQDAKLAGAGVKKGDLGVPDHMMGMDMATNSLKTADPFDIAFLNMMLPHHEGALVMARAELKKGSSPQLKQLATQIISAQRKEITAMKAHAGGQAGGGGHGGHGG